MAVAFQTAKFLIAIIVGGALLAILQMPVDVIEPLALSSLSTPEAQQSGKYISRFWGLAPVFLVLASVIYLIARAVGESQV